MSQFEQSMDIYHTKDKVRITEDINFIEESVNCRQQAGSKTQHSGSVAHIGVK